MSTIKDLEIPAITDMSQDEAIDYLRQLRLRRRSPIKRVSTSTKKKQAQTKTAGKIDKKQAAELLKMLGG